MVMYAIGAPGAAAQITECDPAGLAAKLRPGFVAIEVLGFAAGIIAADGASFVAHVPDLVELKAARREEAKRIRQKRIGQGIVVPGIGPIQTDSGPGRDSLAAIERKAGKAARNPAELIAFTLADNSVPLLTAAQMIEVADLADAHEQDCRAAADAIFALIDAAEDEAALAAIDITAGYPPLPA